MHFGSADVPKEKLKMVLKNNGIDERVRGEALSLEDFIKISNQI